MQADEIMERFGDADGAVAVSGYVNKGAKGRWRVHPWLDPHVYLEFDGRDVLRSLPLDPERSPLGGSYLVLRSNAKVRQVKGDRREAETDFLAGDLVHGALEEAEPIKLALGWTIITVTGTTAPITVTWALGCFTDWVCETGTMRCLGTMICDTGMMACPGTVVVAGPSGDWMCNSHYCPSEGANCPSLHCGGGGGDGGGRGDGPVA